MSDITLQTGVDNKTYKVLNGTWYHANANDDVIHILSNAEHTTARVRVFYGDTDGENAGRDWGDDSFVSGMIGRSTGSIKIPLMIANNRSSGGPGILEHCIVKIIVNGCVVYQHPEYHQPAYETGTPSVLCKDEYTVGVYANGENVINFRTALAARRWVDFMTGCRMGR